MPARCQTARAVYFAKHSARVVTSSYTRSTVTFGYGYPRGELASRRADGVQESLDRCAGYSASPVHLDQDRLARRTTRGRGNPRAAESQQLSPSACQRSPGLAPCFPGKRSSRALRATLSAWCQRPPELGRQVREGLAVLCSPLLLKRFHCASGGSAFPTSTRGAFASRKNALAFTSFFC